MKKKFENVFQFKITLEDIEPPVWRRIQVPEIYTFEELHTAIQDSMGWTDSHLHEFKVIKAGNGAIVRIGTPEGSEDKVLEESKQKIKNYFSKESSTADYIYDFGDGWEHKIKLEEILAGELKAKYPICLAGERACPPEDCGGPGGYIEMLEVMKDNKDERYEEIKEWLGEEFDPEYFNNEDVVFADSQ